MNFSEQTQIWPDSGRFGPSDSRSPLLPSEIEVWNDLNSLPRRITESPAPPAKSLEKMDGKVVATKHDGGKTDWSLLPWDAVEEIIKVLQFGAGKYSPWNWAENGGFKFNRLFNSSMRHFVAWFWRREDLDPETGISHIAHLGCNVLFLLHYVLNGNKFKNNDNRPNLS